MKLGLLGEVLGHSLSPVIHEKLFQKLGISSTYELIEIPKDTFQKDLPTLLSSYDGLNVTIPYKVDVIPFLDGLSQEARTIGAVNTIGRKEGKLWGFNTDYTGFARTLSRIDCDVKGKKAARPGPLSSASSTRRPEKSMSSAAIRRRWTGISFPLPAREGSSSKAMTA